MFEASNGAATRFRSIGLGELPGAAKDLIPTTAQHARRAAAWGLFAAVAAELVALSSGLWPSLVGTAVLAAHPPEARATPLVYWSEFRFGPAEAVGLAALLLALAAALRMAAGSDVALWRLSLLRRETGRAWSRVLSGSFAVLLADLLWRLKALGMPGTHPAVVRALAAMAAAAVFGHMIARMRRLTDRNLSLHGSLLAALMALMAYLTLTAGLAQVLDMMRAFPTGAGELKPLQWAASAVLGALLATYGYFVLMTQKPAHVPGKAPAGASGKSVALPAGFLADPDRHAPMPSTAPPHVLGGSEPARIDAGALLHAHEVLEILGDGTPFLAYTPPRARDLIPAVATYDPNSTGIVVYREDRARRRFVRDRSTYLDLSAPTFLFVDTEAVGQVYRGTVEIGPAVTRQTFMEGEMGWQLKPMRGLAPSSFGASAWQDLRDLLADREFIASTVTKRIRGRVRDLSRALEATTPERMIDRLLRAQGLAMGGALTDPVLDLPAPAEDRLITLSTGLARRAVQRYALRKWTRRVDRAGDAVLAVINTVEDRLAQETLWAALATIRQAKEPGDEPREIDRDLTTLLHWFRYAPMSMRSEIRPTPKAHQLLAMTADVVKTWEAKVDADSAELARIYRDELARVKDKDNLEQTLAHDIKKIIVASLGDPTVLPLVLTHYPIESLTQRILGLVGSSSHATAEAMAESA